MHRWSKQKIGKETLDLNYTLNEMKLTDINSTFYPTAAKYTFFSSIHGMFLRTDHILCQKALNAGEGVEKREPFCTVDGNAN